MTPSIMLVDDEVEILKALERVLHQKFDVHSFTEPEQALAFFRAHPCHIVISDMRMPRMTGAELLTEIAQLQESCKRIILTGYADLALAEEAVNQGKVCCYLAKPWENDKLLDVINGVLLELAMETKLRRTIKRLTLDHQKLQKQFKFLLEQTNESNQQVESVKSNNIELLHFCANLVGYYSNDEDKQNYRIAQQAKLLALRLGLTKSQARNVYCAGLFYKVGSQSLPEELMHKGWSSMTEGQQKQWLTYPRTSADILSSTKELAPCQPILYHLFEHIDGNGFPDQLSNQEIPMESKALSVVLYYDMLTRGDFHDEPIAHGEAKVLINQLVGTIFDFAVVNQFFTMIESPESTESFERVLSFEDLVEGMLLSQDVVDQNGRKLLSAGSVIEAGYLEKLRDVEQLNEQKLLAYVEINP